MLVWWLECLRRWGIPVPLSFSYTSTRMLLAAVTTLLMTIFLGPFFIRKLYAMKIGQSIRKQECPLLGELHRNKEATPTMGGILILASLFLALLFWMNFRSLFTWILAITLLFFGCLGARDDLLKLKYKNPKGLSGKKKFLIQAMLSLILGAFLLYGGHFFTLPLVREPPFFEGVPYSYFLRHLYVPFFREPWFFSSAIWTVGMLLFIGVVITGSSNAINLTDGLDGLAAGCVMMAASGFAIFAFATNHIEMARYLHIAYIEGSGEIAIFLSAMVGALLGFLWYNGYPAQVFMGDIGSLSLGALLGIVSVLMGHALLLALMGGVFVVEALSVIVQVVSFRYRKGKRVFLCAPFHHHFEYKGWSEPKIVLRFWIIAFLLMVLGLVSIKLQ